MEKERPLEQLPVVQGFWLVGLDGPPQQLLIKAVAVERWALIVRHAPFEAYLHAKRAWKTGIELVQHQRELHPLIGPFDVVKTRGRLEKAQLGLAPLIVQLGETSQFDEGAPVYG